MSLSKRYIMRVCGLIVALIICSPDLCAGNKVDEQRKLFVGKPVSLNFQKINLRAVLQLLAEFSGMNIVVSDQVHGDITLRLNDIPWDQALDMILRTNSLEKKRSGNVLLITPVTDSGNQEGRTESQLPLHARLIQINYARAADLALILKENALLSAQGSVGVDVRTNSLWLQDSATKIKTIQQLVKQLDVPVKQVLIEARIVNVTKECVRDLGIRFGVSRPGHLSGSLKGAEHALPVATTPLADRLNVDLAALPFNATPASMGIALAKLGNGVLLDLELSALESEGLGKVIASPRLVTANQQPALIESGEEIPYQQSTSSGATAVAFKKAVLSLKVTPRITPNGKIIMDLQINQDMPSSQLFNGVPAILTREIQTNVLVNNAQTLVLGGIYKQDKNNTITRVPFLGNLPLVGALFRNQTTANKNEELLIFITPRIITTTLSATTIEGRGKSFAKGVELDKFGKPVKPDFPETAAID